MKQDNPKVWGIKVVDSFYGARGNKVSWIVSPCEKKRVNDIKKKSFSGEVIVFTDKKDAEEAIKNITSSPAMMEHNQYSQDVVARQLSPSLKPYAQIVSLAEFLYYL